MDYKKIYYDIINDKYDDNDDEILENINELKVLFSMCSKTLINERKFSYSYVKGCINFLRYLSPNEKALINKDYLCFFKSIDQANFELIKFMFYPESYMIDYYSNNNKFDEYLNKIFTMFYDYYCGNGNNNSNYLPLINLNNAINYYNQKSNNIAYMKRIIILLFLYGFKYNNYEYLYNYLDNPKYYYEKFLNNDILNKNEIAFNRVYYHSTIYRINNNIPEIFSKNKINIR